MSAGYSCNDNQNYFVEEGRTTSRVLAVPGGRSSICLAWDDSDDEKTKDTTKEDSNRNKASLASCAPEKEVTGKIGTMEQPRPAAPTTTQTTNLEESVAAVAAAGVHQSVPWGNRFEMTNVSNNAFASGRNMNSGNVITDRPSSRVIHPPGGKSSIVLG